MKVDFWQLSRDPAEKVVALIARRVLASGERLLVVSKDDVQRQIISRSLWSAGEDSFLANGEASAKGAERQPVLLSALPEAANNASHVIFADGQYRETSGFERVFLLFDDIARDEAAKSWTSLKGKEGMERAFFQQVDGKWVKKA